MSSLDPLSQGSGGSKVDAIAFYLPQYHPIPVNDQHWGKGFTEWANVVRARPLLPGHHQPHYPADLGFYDLRLPEVRAHQRDLALEAGIAAFAVYHYWFHGQRLMEGPVDSFFSDPVHPVKQLLCWANESWTLEWQGDEGTVTLDQSYSTEDDRRHARFLAEGYFANERYYRQDGKAVFLIYNPHLLPDAAATVEILRHEASRVGVDLLIGGCVSFDEVDVTKWGIDFGLRWAPNWLTLRQGFDERRTRLARAQTRLLSKRWPRFRHNEFYDYSRVREAHLATPRPSWPVAESAFPSWDNTARRMNGDAIIIQNESGPAFETWLRALVARLRLRDPDMVFINAWNEWAEGCHLEPDGRVGHLWLDTCRRVFG